MEADVVPNATEDRPSSAATLEDDVLKKLESFSLASKSRTSLRCHPKKRLRSVSGGDERSSAVRRPPGKLTLRRSKLDHLFKSRKIALRPSVLSKRAGSAPPPENRVNPLPPLPELVVVERPVVVLPDEDEVDEVPVRPPPARSNNLPDVVRKTCSQEANFAFEEVSSVDELAGYLENGLHIPKKMSEMAEMMYA